MWRLRVLEVFDGALNTAKLYSKWERLCQEKNAGALCVFTGIVRGEGQNFKGLSFDVHLPLLQTWFSAWEQRGYEVDVKLCMAHAKGDVEVGQSSYMVGLISAHRKEALNMYALFIEDFKHNAPIWKYELKEGQRIYAQDQSHPLKGSGLLA